MEKRDEGKGTYQTSAAQRPCPAVERSGVAGKLPASSQISPVLPSVGSPLQPGAVTLADSTKTSAEGLH